MTFHTSMQRADRIVRHLMPHIPPVPAKQDKLILPEKLKLRRSRAFTELRPKTRCG